MIIKGIFFHQAVEPEYFYSGFRRLGIRYSFKFKYLHLYWINKHGFPVI